MTLSASSALVYAPFRGGSVIPYVGGTPHHTRSSAGSWIDQNGILQSAIVNTPRFNYAALAGSTERRQLLTLEQARTNRMTYSEDFTQWTATNTTLTSGQIDPKGGTGAYLLNATVGSGSIKRTLTWSGDGTKVSSIFFKAGTGAVSRLEMLDATAPASRHLIGVTWDAAGTPTLSTLNGSGTRFTPVSMGGGWWAIAWNAPSNVAANTNQIVISPAGTGTGTVYAFGVQGEDAIAPSSYIATGSATVARSVDQFYTDYVPVPQAAMKYCRFVERGTLSVGGRIWELGKSDASSPHAFVYSDGTYYRFRHQTAAGQSESVLAAAPTIGDTVELLALLASDGSTKLIQSINGAAVTSASDATAKTLQAAWADTKLWLNSAGATNGPGLADFADLKFVKYADVVGATDADRMTELRAYELGANGELVNPGS